MARDTKTGRKELARQLGERGDFVAVQSSDIARDVTGSDGVQEDAVRELREATEEIDSLLEKVEAQESLGESGIGR